MLAPDIAYAFRQPKDISGPTMEVLCRHLDSAASATVIDLLITDLPKDRMLILGNVTMRGSPGATQHVASLQIIGITAAGLEFDIARLTPVLTADLIQTLNWQGGIYLMGGGLDTTTIRVRGVFNSGTNSNSVRTGIHGIVVPRANVSPF